ncbi:hypothetical protein Plhal304r1_c014g0054161 [Plasmopara halstedii]
MTTTYGDRIRVAKTGPVQPPKGTLQRIDSNYHILKLRSFFSLCLLGIRVARLDVHFLRSLHARKTPICLVT